MKILSREMSNIWTLLSQSTFEYKGYLSKVYNYFFKIILSHEKTLKRKLLTTDILIAHKIRVSN